MSALKCYNVESVYEIFVSGLIFTDLDSGQLDKTVSPWGVSLQLIKRPNSMK